MFLINNFKGLKYQVDLPPSFDSHSNTHVDLGSGITPRNPFGAGRLIATDFDSVGLTLKNGSEFIGCDLTDELPFADGSISSCSAFDVLEHIPRWERSNSGITFPFINLMQEIYRILEPGGYFLAVTPAFPSPAAFQDPTHVNVITRDTLSYFALPTVHANELGYGFVGSFETVYEGWLRSVGPYSQSRLLAERSFFSKNGFIAWLKLAKRFSSALIKRNPTHLIWLLRKPL